MWYEHILICTHIAMADYQQQMKLVQQSLEDIRPVPPEELLLMRDQHGHLARVMEPAPGVTPREAAALLLFYPDHNRLWFPLTVRSATLPQHRGEVSLPGGATEPDDADVVDTALRETHEELGIAPQMISVWGTLTTIYIPPSNFRLTPVVGYMSSMPELKPEPGEIDDVFCVCLDVLYDTATVVVEEWTLHGARVFVPFFALQGHKVWGATALILSELLARLRRIEAHAP